MVFYFFENADIKGETKLSLKLTGKKLFLRSENTKKYFDIVEKVSHFLIDFLNFFDMRSLQIRRLFSIGPKLDFISSFENLAVLKVYDPVERNKIYFFCKKNIHSRYREELEF